MSELPTHSGIYISRFGQRRQLKESRSPLAYAQVRTETYHLDLDHANSGLLSPVL
ncbi:hypothetical protein M5D96_007872, partial [Drosophila gunungcola]